MNYSSKKIISNYLFVVASVEGRRHHGHHSGEFSLKLWSLAKLIKSR